MGYWINSGIAFSQLSVGNSNCIWGIQGNQIVQKSSTDPSGWKTMPLPQGSQFGSPKSIGCSEDGTVLMTDSNQYLYRWDSFSNSWNFFALSRMQEIFVGNTKYVYGIDNNGIIYKYLQEDQFKVISDPSHLENKITNLSVGDDDALIGVNIDNQLMRYLGENMFQMVPNIEAKLVSVANSNLILAVTTANKIKQYLGEGYWEDYLMIDHQGKALPDGNITAISAGVDGCIFMLLNGNAYQYIPYNF